MQKGFGTTWFPILRSFNSGCTPLQISQSYRVPSLPDFRSSQTPSPYRFSVCPALSRAQIHLLHRFTPCAESLYFLRGGWIWGRGWIWSVGGAWFWTSHGLRWAVVPHPGIVNVVCPKERLWSGRIQHIVLFSTLWWIAASWLILCGSMTWTNVTRGPSESPWP